jgi:Na+/melibiose symporter-like transporter
VGAQNGILLAWVLIPGILLAICFLTMKWYPLAGEHWNATKKALAEKHREKERLYLEKLGYKTD